MTTTVSNDNILTLTEQIKAKKDLNLIKIDISKNNKILAKCKKTIETLENIDIAHIQALFNKKIIINGFTEHKKIIVAASYVSTTNEIWQLIIQARGLLVKITEEYKKQKNSDFWTDGNTNIISVKLKLKSVNNGVNDFIESNHEVDSMSF